jgi:uncharacterized phage-associated protein
MTHLWHFSCTIAKERRKNGTKTIMEQFMFNEQKAVAVVLLVVNEFKKIDRHKLAKILYFADEKHLSRYGRTITTDSYNALPNGPVPTIIYDCIKGVNCTHNFYEYRGFEGKISVSGKYIEPLDIADLDQLSETDIECLFESIAENSGLSFGELTKKSHGQAWHSVGKNQRISFVEMAKEANTPDDIMELVRMNLEIEEFLTL